MSDTTFVIFLLILVGGTGLLVGGVIGAILSRGYGGQENGPAKGKNLTEVLHVWRDKRSNRPVLEVGGKLYEKPGDLPEKSRQGLARLAQELSLWSGVSMPEAAPRPSPAAAAVVGLTADSLVDALRADVGGEAASAGLPPAPPTVRVVPVTPPVNPNVKPVSTDVGNLWWSAFAGSDKKKEAPVAPLSIAAQIDEVVQERLPGSALRNRVIKVMDVPPHSLAVIVDRERFDGVNDVSDPEVRQFLRQCVAEWEQRGV